MNRHDCIRTFEHAFIRASMLRTHGYNAYLNEVAVIVHINTAADTYPPPRWFLPSLKDLGSQLLPNNKPKSKCVSCKLAFRRTS